MGTTEATTAERPVVYALWDTALIVDGVGFVNVERGQAWSRGHHVVTARPDAFSETKPERVVVAEGALVLDPPALGPKPARPEPPKPPPFAKQREAFSARMSARAERTDQRRQERADATDPAAPCFRRDADFWGSVGADSRLTARTARPAMNAPERRAVRAQLLALWGLLNHREMQVLRHIAAGAETSPSISIELAQELINDQAVAEIDLAGAVAEFGVTTTRHLAIVDRVKLMGEHREQRAAELMAGAK